MVRIVNGMDEPYAFNPMMGSKWYLPRTIAIMHYAGGRAQDVPQDDGISARRLGGGVQDGLLTDNIPSKSMIYNSY